jgi:KDO2-lipid IV(A) lauroyltransferase
MTLLNRLVQKTHAQVFFAYAERLPGEQGFRLNFEAATSQIASEDITTSATYMNHAIEKIVAANPSQYQWNYKRFRTRPPGESRIYP